MTSPAVEIAGNGDSARSATGQRDDGDHDDEYWPSVPAMIAMQAGDTATPRLLPRLSCFLLPQGECVAEGYG